MDGSNRMETSLSDEEDLEALRLAALQSLKKNAGDRDGGFLNSHLKGHNFTKGLRKRGRYFQNQSRNAKNGQFLKGQYNRIPGQYNNRVRNTNLISITPVQTSEEQPSTKSTSDAPKLILPQDRYIKTSTVQPEKNEGPVSKFDRYDNSESESEEDEDDDEEEEAEVETKSPAQSSLKRSDSLEELMKELEDEIQGESRASKEPKAVKETKEPKPAKNKVKRKKSNTIESTSEGTAVVSKDVANSKDKSGVVPEKIENPVKPVVTPETENNCIEKVSKEDDNKVTEHKMQPKKPIEVRPQPSNKCGSDSETRYSPLKNRHLNRSPSHRKTDFHRKNIRSFPQNQQTYPQTSIPPNSVFSSQTPPYISYANTIPPVSPVYLPGFIPTNIPPPTGVRVPPINFMPTPLSPLTINTDTINTTITAPLSPRSAAFVLENRAIIEKRKRSPRRSYSRSPSPRSRHSSPRRSYTPKRSLSPKLSPRLSRRSPSPKKAPLSPRRYSPKRRSRSPRRSLSPVRRVSPLPRRYSPKRTRTQLPPANRGSVYERLGVKVGNKTDAGSSDFRENERVVRRSRSRSSTPLKDEKPLEPVDPIMEARRKKFETNEIKNKDGVIRLKPRSDDNKDKEIVKTEVAKEIPAPVKKEVEVVKKEDKKEKEDKKDVDIKKESKESVSKPEEISTKPDEESSLMDTKDEDDDKIDGLSDLNEDELLGYDDLLDLSPPVERLLSDEESDPENEGRFKAKLQTDPKVPVLPFTKLVNNQKSSEFKENKVAKSPPNSSRSSPKLKYTKRKRTPSPVPDRTAKVVSKEKGSSTPTISSKVKDVSSENRYERQLRFAGRLPVSSRMKVKVDKPPITTPIENKRIEIKIRNPSKYSKTSDEKTEDKERDENKCVYTSRKVEITKREESSSESETEILVENEDDGSIEPVDRHGDGDLRAQLSRKRAERQRRPESERSSRLLHSALDGAVFKKVKKSKKEKEAKKDYQALRQLLKLEKLKRNMNRAVKSYSKLRYYEHFELSYDPDVKLPIHLRLGIANAAELFSPKKKKSSKKHRKRALEQV